MVTAKCQAPASNAVGLRPSLDLDAHLDAPRPGRNPENEEATGIPELVTDAPTRRRPRGRVLARFDDEPNRWLTKVVGILPWGRHDRRPPFHA